MSGASNGGLLVQPSALLPWSVEVVSAVPKSIMELGEGEEPKRKKKKLHSTIPKSQINAGAVCPGWACLSSWKGRIHVWPTNSNNNSSTAKFSIDAPPNCVTLFHPSLVGLNEGENPLLLALTRASPDAVFVYAAKKTNGNLVAWKVTRDDVQRARVVSMPNIAYAQAYLPLTRKEMEDEEDLANEAAGELIEFPCCVAAVDRHTVILGTTRGGMICCALSTIPLALRAQRMTKTASSRKSLMGRLFGSSDENDGSPNDDSAMRFLVPLEDAKVDCQELLAVSHRGSIWRWKIETTVASSHRVKTEARYMTNMGAILVEHMPNLAAMPSMDVCQFKLRGDRVHVLVRVQSDASESRLFWIRLRIDGGDLHWIDCQWLNRFPAPQDVEAMGLIISENGFVYGVFHQGSGGICSSVIVMGFQDLDERDPRNVEIYEVDLPNTEIPSMLPGTFSNDIVTHGCSLFARSGLGIRVRALPPTATNPLSPRAAQRANPSAVMKLAGHLRSAFWYSYQHGANTAALPPSVRDASSADLEEAVITVATQIHVQRSVDQTGWTSVTSALEANALEIHLSLITWLRHGGVYRSLGPYAKWRLLSIGMEIAAFLALTATTRAPTSKEQELMSGLSLANVAEWLKETQDKTLRDGGTDQYQLYCGWLSTALATSMSYRKERSVSTYDIPINTCPIVGSKKDVDENKVPVWTSHHSLRGVFGNLLDYWKNHPKQKSIHVLPLRTVEVIAQAALESFADSATCLGSERATGEYAEIKALTIPILRTLHASAPHPEKYSDDKLAFEQAINHDYYEGICQIAHDHENKEDAESFRLTTLLQSTDACQSLDFQTGFTFGQFVLNWFTDRGLFGHTLMYGRLCPERDLNHILNTDERMRPYRWIQAVHKGNYSGAASSLMTQDTKSSTATLAETKWSFCMAKLANHVVLKESQSQRKEAEKCEEKINKNLELIGVQNRLAPTGQHLWSANRLLSRALEQAEQAMKEAVKDQTAEAVNSLYLGLIVCTTFEDKSIQRRQASHVWAKSIDLEFDARWADWIRTEDDLSRDALAQQILDTTVFGGLLQDCNDEEALSTVGFSDTMQQETLERLGVPGESLRRLLRSVVNTFLDAKKDYADEDMVDVANHRADAPNTAVA